MAEGGRLESGCSGEPGTVGSNPTLSIKFKTSPLNIDVILQFQSSINEKNC